MNSFSTYYKNAMGLTSGKGYFKHPPIYVFLATI